MNAAIQSNSPPPSPAPPRPPSGFLSWLGTALPTLLALSLLGGVGAWGYWKDWKLPKFANLLSGKEDETDKAKDEDSDWCEKHDAPKDSCIECKPDSFPKPRTYGWCETHGVHDCVLDHPDVAQLPATPQFGEAKKKRAKQALDSARPKENNKDCKLHPRCIQLKSREAMERAGIETQKAISGTMVGSVMAPGEISFDPTRVARISARAPGTVRQVLRSLGEKVERGDVVALVESADVSRAKADFLQAVAQLNLLSRKLTGMRKEPGSIPAARLLEAETAVEEAKIRMLGAEQALVSLGLPARAADFKNLEPEELARRVRVLGLSPDILRALDDKLAAANLLPIIAPRAGEVVDRQAVAGEVIDTKKVLLTIADTRRLWLTVHVRQEDGGRLKVGQQLEFRPDTGADKVSSRISWISPEVDSKTRTILVRAELTNTKRRLRANTFGEGMIVQRVEEHAVLVPTSAVHSDGNCQIVFVFDKRSAADASAPVVFHVRSVRVGARAGKNTEIIVGVLPGELVATEGSAALRGQLLKDSLGD